MSMFVSRFVIKTRQIVNPRKIIHVLSNVNDKPRLSANLISRNFMVSGKQLCIELDEESKPLKKKKVHKKVVLEELPEKEGHFLTLAYATAYSYDLLRLRQALFKQNLYQPGTLNGQDMDDVVIANAVYDVSKEPREIVFFRQGSVVFWNCSEYEAHNVLNFIKQFEIESYPKDVVIKEREVMTYFYKPNGKTCHLHDESFALIPNGDNTLEKYTFSHAMAQSARLGTWEEKLERLAASIRVHTSLMEKEGAVPLDKKEIVRKLGQLFSLRHRLNVESDLLDLPDIYWEEDRLGRLYSKTMAYFTITRRTRIINERLSHCVELLELLWSWAADRHHVRLEWMVIALILAEVCFELIYCWERYYPATTLEHPAELSPSDDSDGSTELSLNEKTFSG